MKIKEIRGMDRESLNDRLIELKKELIKVNAQVAIGTAPKSPGQVRAIKKTIAQILTILKEKEGENKEVERKKDD
ncbi:50S ribosomal protein L29 [Candidatus Woesearchaeota archaeon]|nr:50S ribosomal protein L29 [Candidatus Woesearchaeota archaeon]